MRSGSGALSTRGTNLNVTVMAEAVLPGYGKIYLAFLIHVAKKFSFRPFIFLLHVVN